MHRNEGIPRLGQVAPGIRSALGTTPSEVQGSAARPSRDFDVNARDQRGDHDLNPGMHPERRLTAAAVLVPLIDRADGLTVLLTKRTDHLHDHAGQISFPGGRVDPEDRDAAAAALREAKEEVGLDPDRVDLIARLDTYVTRTGFEVVPWVGLIMPPVALMPDPFEVAEVFEVPLAFFLDPASRRTESRVW